MLKALFTWLDGHPASYWCVALGSTLLLLAWVVARVWREPVGSPVAPLRPGWRDYLMLFLFLLAWRWPFLLVAHDYNPDEGQQIAGALTLAHDPIFWRAVDGNTSGPLNFYVLVPLRWLGLPLDYFTARLAGLCFVAGALACVLRALADHFGRAAAWLGVLPGAAFFATTTSTDLIHYSTEHFPLLVAAAAIACLAGRPDGDRRRLWAGCFLAGCLPLTKLQAAPIGLAIFGWGLGQIFRERGPDRWPRAGGAVAAALVPLLLVVTMVLVTGETEAAVRRFFLHNISYVGEDNLLRTAWFEMAGLAKADGRFPLLLATALGGALAAAVFFAARRKRPPALLFIAAGLVVIATCAVFTPRRGFVHYLLLLPVPLTLLFGAALGGGWNLLNSVRSRRALGLAALAVGCILPVATRCERPVPDIFGKFVYYWNHPRTSAAEVVHALAGKEGPLAIWGWNNSLYVETALPQATRDATSLWSILPNAQQAYHRATYLADFRRHAPTVFVDAVGPGAFSFDDRPAQAHEIFPELAEEIRQHYKFVADLGDCRVYARADLGALRGMDSNRVDQLVARGRMKTAALAAVPPPLRTLDHYTYRFVGDQSVIMLLPPAQMEWELGADVRAVTVDFGFDPVAYLQGHGNGAEMVLELVNDGRTRLLFNRLLDPERRPADRGRQVARVLLPPFAPGARLVLRTTPGAHGDQAWDWIYLGGVEFERHAAFLPEQFPGFERMPDSVNGDGVVPLRDGTTEQLMLHAPGALRFALVGNEQRLEFGYGIGAGAYSAGGNTDGAVFRVELQRAGAPPRVLFERFLQPVNKPADRGPQRAVVVLPALRPGDMLVLSTDPGPDGNAAWDWTYISGFRLK